MEGQGRGKVEEEGEGPLTQIPGSAPAFDTFKRLLKLTFSNPINILTMLPT